MARRRRIPPSSFTAYIAACFVLGRHFSRTGRPGFAVASRLSGLAFALGDLWAMTGGPAGSLPLAIGAITGVPARDGSSGPITS